MPSLTSISNSVARPVSLVPRETDGAETHNLKVFFLSLVFDSKRMRWATGPWGHYYRLANSYNLITIGPAPHCTSEHRHNLMQPVPFSSI